MKHTPCTNPFTLSLSKGRGYLLKGFDKLSPNGGGRAPC